MTNFEKFIEKLNNSRGSLSHRSFGIFIKEEDADVKRILKEYYTYDNDRWLKEMQNAWENQRLGTVLFLLSRDNCPFSVVEYCISKASHNHRDILLEILKKDGLTKEHISKVLDKFKHSLYMYAKNEKDFIKQLKELSDNALNLITKELCENPNKYDAELHPVLFRAFQFCKDTALLEDFAYSDNITDNIAEYLINNTSLSDETRMYLFTNYDYSFNIYDNLPSRMLSDYLSSISSTIFSIPRKKIKSDDDLTNEEARRHFEFGEAKDCFIKIFPQISEKDKKEFVDNIFNFNNPDAQWFLNYIIDRDNNNEVLKYIFSKPVSFSAYEVLADRNYAENSKNSVAVNILSDFAHKILKELDNAPNKGSSRPVKGDIIFVEDIFDKVKFSIPEYLTVLKVYNSFSNTHAHYEKLILSPNTPEEIMDIMWKNLSSVVYEDPMTKEKIKFFIDVAKKCQKTNFSEDDKKKIMDVFRNNFTGSLHDLIIGKPTPKDWFEKTQKEANIVFDANIRDVEKFFEENVVGSVFIKSTGKYSGYRAKLNDFIEQCIKDRQDDTVLKDFEDNKEIDISSASSYAQKQINSMLMSKLCHVPLKDLYIEVEKAKPIIDKLSILTKEKNNKEELFR